MKNQLSKLEVQIDDLEKKVLEMDEALEKDYEETAANPSFFDNYKDTKNKIEVLMSDWEKLEEKIENCS